MSTPQGSPRQNLDGLSAAQLRRLLTEHLTKQKLGLYWEASAIERDAALSAYDSTMLGVVVYPLSEEVPMHYARIRLHLAQEGTPIGPNDTLIAAHALALGATLVTGNETEFRRVPGLQVENWLR